MQRPTLPRQAEVDWAALFRSSYKELADWASSFAGPSAEDLVAEAFYIGLAEDWKPANPVGWVRSKVRQLWVTFTDREMSARARLERWAVDLDPEIASEPTFLYPLRRNTPAARERRAQLPSRQNRVITPEQRQRNRERAQARRDRLKREAA